MFEACSLGAASLDNGESFLRRSQGSSLAPCDACSSPKWARIFLVKAKASRRCSSAVKTTISGANSPMNSHPSLRHLWRIVPWCSGIFRWRAVHRQRQSVMTQLEMMSHVPRVFGPSCQCHGGTVELGWNSVDVDWFMVDKSAGDWWQSSVATSVEHREPCPSRDWSCGD